MQLYHEKELEICAQVQLIATSMMMVMMMKKMIVMMMMMMSVVIEIFYILN